MTGELNEVSAIRTKELKMYLQEIMHDVVDKYDIETLQVLCLISEHLDNASEVLYEM